MMKNTLILLTLIALFSCTRNDQVKIEYVATSAISEFNIFYLNPGGELQHEVVKPKSAIDMWSYSYFGEQGDVVYISGRYTDPNSSLKLLIKVDGKIYKQAQNEGDTLRFLTVSGVAK